MKLKWCYKCGQQKISDDFYHDKSKSDGLKAVCKVCDNKRKAAYYKDHPELTKKYRERFAKKYPGYFNQKYREFYTRNPDKERSRVTEWRNKGKIAKRIFTRSI